jgi:RNA polymerase sigma factor (sigma-70 family)
MAKFLVTIVPEESNNLVKTSHVRSVFANHADEKVWRLFIKGDNKAFIFIYDKYFTSLFRYGRQFTSDKELIKDTIHDIFLDFKTSKYKVSNTTSVRFYLLMCLKNRLINKLKKQRKMVHIDDSLDGFNFGFTISIEQDVIDMQLKEETVARLNEAIDKLTFRQKEAIYYLFYQNFSIDEIMEMMQLDNRRSVQNLIYKGLANLRGSIFYLFLLGFERTGIFIL